MLIRTVFNVLHGSCSTIHWLFITFPNSKLIVEQISGYFTNILIRISFPDHLLVIFIRRPCLDREYLGESSQILHLKLLIFLLLFKHFVSVEFLLFIYFLFGHLIQFISLYNAHLLIEFFDTVFLILFYIKQSKCVFDEARFDLFIYFRIVVETW